MTESAIVLDYPIDLGSMDSLSHYLLNEEHASTFQVVTLNPEMMMKGKNDPAFGTILKQAQLRLPDGAGVVWALKRQGLAQQRLPGIEMAETLLEKLAAKGSRVCLIGANEEVNQAAQKAVQARYKGLTLGFCHHGFFRGGEQSDSIAQQAADSHPRLVLVALGVPRQETWIAEHAHRFSPGTILMGVGGSFDVWSGTVQRAPALLRALHMEWVWRLASQPWRIQRAGGPLLRFAWAVLRQG